jgi:protein tyrosine/serine phosphatase
MIHIPARARWRRARRIAFYALAALLVLVGVKYGKRLVVLHNFGVVEEGRVYRAGQPMPYQLKRLIRTYGIRTVVNTREPEAWAWLMKEEQTICEREGVRMVRIPMPGDGLGTYEQFDEALAILANPTNLPALVHCARGSYRTGAVIAGYRVLVEGWTEQDAVVEMKRYGARRSDHVLVPYIDNYFRSRLAGERDARGD